MMVCRWVVFHSSYNGIFCFSFFLFSLDFREESTYLAIFYLKPSVPSKTKSWLLLFQILQWLLSLGSIWMPYFDLHCQLSSIISQILLSYSRLKTSWVIIIHNSLHISKSCSHLGLCHLSGISFKVSQDNFKVLVGRMLR